jgi:thiamine transport system permease protein
MGSLDLLVTTAFVALASAVVAVALGYPVGHWLSSLRRLRRLVTGVLLVPFLLPAFLVGLALRPLLGDALETSWVAVGSIISAHVLMNAGFLAAVTAASMTPRDQIEAGRLDGASTIQLRWYLQLPQQLPALSAAGLLVALYSATSYGLVVTLGQGSVRTLETEIASAALQRLDLPTAGFLALLQCALTISFFVVARRLGATPTVLFGEGESATSRSWVGGALGIGLVGAILWVIGGVFARAFSEGAGLGGNVSNLAGRGARDILNLSVVEALGNSLRNMVVAVLISLVVAWWLSRRRAGLLVLFPIGISPVVIGLVALVLSGYVSPALSGGWWVLPLVQSLFLTPLAFQIIAPARRAMSPDILEAAQLDGASRAQLFGLIELPTVARPVVAAAALTSLASLGEFGAASFLAYGSQQTLPLVMFRLMSRPGSENLGMAMAAASIFIFVALLVVWSLSFLRSDSTPGRRDGLVV